ncbi:MAG: ABC transporter permease [Thermoleophilia bacterium]
MTVHPVAFRPFDLSATPAVPFGRLVSVETRKMADTRAGRWLLIGIGLITAAILGVMLVVAVAKDLSLGFRDFLTAVSIPMGILLPVLGVLSVTQEFGQRTALTTFTQVPSRMRVLRAKFAAALGLATAGTVLGMVLAAAAYGGYALLSDLGTGFNAGPGDLGRFLLVQALGLVGGLAFGALLLNSAAAIVVLFSVTFVLTGLFELGAQTIGWFGDLRPWIDFQAAQGPLVDGGVSATEWSHLLVSSLPWLVVPLLVGLRRILRAEVK